MKTIRKIVFETNSSSTHVLTMCSDDEFKGWEEGKFLYSMADNKLVPSEEAKYKSPDYYLTKEQYDRYVDNRLEDCAGDYFEDSYNNVKAFGYFYTDY